MVLLADVVANASATLTASPDNVTKRRGSVLAQQLLEVEQREQEARRPSEKRPSAVARPSVSL